MTDWFNHNIRNWKNCVCSLERRSVINTKGNSFHYEKKIEKKDVIHLERGGVPRQTLWNIQDVQIYSPCETSSRGLAQNGKKLIRNIYTL